MSSKHPDSTDGVGVAQWYVVHTKARCEKKVFQYCLSEGVEAALPTCRSVRKYDSKTVAFELPVFPGYVFVRVTPLSRGRIRQNRNVANLFAVSDQELFQRQLARVIASLSLGAELDQPVMDGARARIMAGPLRGLEGTFDRLGSRVQVTLRIDFMSRAAAVRVNAADVETL